MEKTSNYELNKPASNEVINIDVLNENMDIIDAALADIAETTSEMKTTIVTKLTDIENDLDSHRSTVETKLEELEEEISNANITKGISVSRGTLINGNILEITNKKGELDVQFRQSENQCRQYSIIITADNVVFPTIYRASIPIQTIDGAYTYRQINSIRFKNSIKIEVTGIVDGEPTSTFNYLLKEIV